MFARKGITSRLSCYCLAFAENDIASVSKLLRAVWEDAKADGFGEFRDLHGDKRQYLADELIKLAWDR